jgi:hypothetical protein
MISREAFEWDVLADGLEDRIGLYEIVWDANSKFPDQNLGFKYDLAESIVRAFWKKGWIELIQERSPWALADPDEENGPISADRLDSIISNPTSWYPCNSDNLLIAYLTTEAGKAALDAHCRS